MTIYNQNNLNDQHFNMNRTTIHIIFATTVIYLTILSIEGARLSIKPQTIDNIDLSHKEGVQNPSKDIVDNIIPRRKHEELPKTNHLPHVRNVYEDNDLFSNFESETDFGSESDFESETDFESEPYNEYLNDSPGFEPHTSPSPSKPEKKKGQNVSVIIGTKKSAYLFHNDLLIGSVNSWKIAKQFQFEIFPHDVISIVAKGSSESHGIIAVVTVDKRKIVTGNSEFKAIPLRLVKGNDRILWRNPKFEACEWNSTITISEGDESGKTFPKKFPHHTGAKFVWANEGLINDIVFFRLLIDGQKCGPSSSNNPSPLSTPTLSPGHQTPVKKCSCRQTESETEGSCFRFINKWYYSTFNKNRICLKETCSPTYECTGIEINDSNICILRYAYSEVRIILPESKRRCINVWLESPKQFYEPYISKGEITDVSSSF